MASGREIKCHVIWEWIFLQGRRTYLIKLRRCCPSVLKRQYSLSCFTVTLQLDILISFCPFQFSLRVTARMPVRMYACCLSVPCTKKAAHPKRQHKVNVRVVRTATWPLVTWATGRSTRDLWKSMSPTAIEDFTVVMVDVFSHCFAVEVLKLRLVEAGTREMGNISTPKCSFLKHISSCLHTFQQFIICWQQLKEECHCDIMQMYSVEYHKHSWIAMRCRMWILCALTLCWITNDVGLTCLLECLPHTQKELHSKLSERREQQQTSPLYLIKSVSYCQSKLIHSDSEGKETFRPVLNDMGFAEGWHRHLFLRSESEDVGLAGSPSVF